MRFLGRKWLKNCMDIAYSPVKTNQKTAYTRRVNFHPKVGFVSLGYPKALVDSELILTQLKAGV
jgi:hypothetical protein